MAACLANALSLPGSQPPTTGAALPAWSPTAVLGRKGNYAPLGVQTAKRAEKLRGEKPETFSLPLPSPTARLPPKWALTARRQGYIGQDSQGSSDKVSPNAPAARALFRNLLTLRQGRVNPSIPPDKKLDESHQLSMHQRVQRHSPSGVRSHQRKTHSKSTPSCGTSPLMLQS